LFRGQIEEHGLTRKDVKFTDAVLKKLIREYTREAGVRQLNAKSPRFPQGHS